MGHVNIHQPLQNITHAVSFSFFVREGEIIHRHSFTWSLTDSERQFCMECSIYYRKIYPWNWDFEKAFLFGIALRYSEFEQCTWLTVGNFWLKLKFLLVPPLNKTLYFIFQLLFFFTFPLAYNIPLPTSSSL